VTAIRVFAALAILLAALPAAAAEGEGGGLFYPILNLVLLLALLVYFARKPVLQYFGERRAAIQTDIHRASELRRDAEKRFAEWQRKLAELDGEIERIRATSRGRAESERDQIVADATAAAARIRADAQAAVAQELRRARKILREEAADLAVELAGNLLAEQVTEADRERLVGEFIERIERDPAAGKAGASN
jgi:F-type H+-transporting ATPase subunit b